MKANTHVVTGGGGPPGGGVSMAVIQNPLDIDMAQRAPIIITIKMAAVLIGRKIAVEWNWLTAV